MKDLHEAIGIFLKYGNPHNPTWCEHDILHVCIDSSAVSDEDKKRLGELGFYVDSEEGFYSNRYGNA